jgi:hypothetical protein
MTDASINSARDRGVPASSSAPGSAAPPAAGISRAPHEMRIEPSALTGAADNRVLPGLSNVSSLPPQFELSSAAIMRRW